MADAQPTQQYEHPKRPVPTNWVERLRDRLPQDSCRRRLFDIASLPVSEPTEFAIDPAELARKMMPSKGRAADKAARATEILQQAQAIYQEAEDRASGAAARATTLQGAIGIAATLLIAGAGLIVGQTALQGKYWVLAFAALLFGAIVALVMSGLRALAAASTIHQWHRPKGEDIIARSQIAVTDARIAQAADVLFCFGYNSKVAAWKVAYLGAAAWWYRIALGLIVSIAMLVAIYSVSTTNQPKKRTAAAVAATPKAVTNSTKPAASQPIVTSPSH